MTPPPPLPTHTLTSSQPKAAGSPHGAGAPVVARWLAAKGLKRVSPAAMDGAGVRVARVVSCWPPSSSTSLASSKTSRITFSDGVMGSSGGTSGRSWTAGGGGGVAGSERHVETLAPAVSASCSAAGLEGHRARPKSSQGGAHVARQLLTTDDKGKDKDKGKGKGSLRAGKHLPGSRHPAATRPRSRVRRATEKLHGIATR